MTLTPLAPRLRRLLEQIGNAIETLADVTVDPIPVLSALVSNFDTARREVPTVTDPKLRRMAAGQLTFSVNQLNGLIEALRRQQLETPIKPILVNLHQGLERVLVELRGSGLPAPEKPKPDATEQLQGADWQTALERIKNRLLNPDTELDDKETEDVAEDLSFLSDADKGTPNFLDDDENYGLIESPIFVLKGRVDSFAKAVLADNNYNVRAFLESYHMIGNASLFGIVKDMHNQTAINSALRGMGKNLVVCSNGVEVGNHVYYVVAPATAAKDHHMVISNWGFHKKAS